MRVSAGRGRRGLWPPGHDGPGPGGAGLDVRDLEAEGVMEPEAQREMVVQEPWLCKGVAALRSRRTSSTLRTAGRRCVVCARMSAGCASRVGGRVERRSGCHGSRDAWTRGKAVDVFAGQEGALQLLCREAVGGLVVERREQADFTDIGLLGTLALAAELQRSNQVLAQWGS